MKYIIDLKSVNLSHIASVGGKNASTGEMIQNLSQKGINVPGGFAITVEAYKKFLAQNELDKRILQTLSHINVNQVSMLNKRSAEIRRWIIDTPFFPELVEEIKEAYATLMNGAVAVRSSAVAEDLPNASFAGQQETYLNIKGLKNLLKAIKLVFASIFTSRAISYRQHHNFEFDKIGLSVGIQPMIRSDKGASGVIFTLDTESGFDKVVLVTGSYGLGEAIAQGSVNPDEFYVYKPSLEAKKFAILQRRLGEKSLKMVYSKANTPRDFIKKVPVSKAEQTKYCLTDDEVQTLAKYAVIIEKHYQRPMDIEWAKDGLNGQLYILQARPETVKSRGLQKQEIEQYVLSKRGKVLSQGQSIGQQIGQGNVRIILDLKKMQGIKPGEVLVTDMTDPDWEPIMKRASAIITNRGGRTCHAAIIARELGIPAVVGCGDATSTVKEGEAVTVSCAEGQTGYVYQGNLPFSKNKIVIKDMPKLPIKICINLGNPDKAFDIQFLPNDGVGLARIEFIISNMIGIHPNAILRFQSLPKALQTQIKAKTAAYANPVEYYIEKLREGISMIAAAFSPKEVIFRFSDFKSNEYANLLGGYLFEPREENPMLGFRGASRYKDEKFESCFELECKAFKRVRDEMGLVNAQVMIPFVRTERELQDVINVINKYGLKRGTNGLKIYMMCEIPSNALLAEQFLQHVDGFSIGSNDLTQLVLGLDRDSSIVAALFDERDEAIKMLLHKAIEACNRQGKYVGICGQGPSDHPDFAEWLMKEGIQSISLNPDTVVETWLLLAKKCQGKASPSGNARPEKMSSQELCIVGADEVK